MKLVCPFCSGSFEENVKPDVATYPCRYCGMDIDPKAPPRVHVRTTPSKKPAAPKPAASNQSKPSSAQRQTAAARAQLSSDCSLQSVRGMSG